MHGGGPFWQSLECLDRAVLIEEVIDLNWVDGSVWQRTCSVDLGDPDASVVVDLCTWLTASSCHILWSQPVAVKSNVRIEMAELLENDMGSDISFFVAVEVDKNHTLAQVSAVDVGD